MYMYKSIERVKEEKDIRNRYERIQDSAELVKGCAEELAENARGGLGGGLSECTEGGDGGGGGSH